jgi:hypothetical protein
MALTLSVALPCAAHPAGAMSVNGEALSMRDAARITGAAAAGTQLNLEAASDGAHFMLIEMAQSDD